MGIQGLLPFLKDASHQINVRKYSGYTVAVDTYCWIHRGAFGCAMQLAKGEDTDMYVRYCMKFINMLRSMDIKPILVFDGSHLPAKKIVEESRRERRELYSKKGRQFLREGKVSEARDCFTKCVNVTPQMALEVMKAARSLDVDCIVAPYEADAQLAYLAKKGITQAIITEDSDLVAFGCPRVIYKLDLNGNGLEIEASRLNKATKMGTKYSADKFRFMCITAGCDYLPSLPGIGLGKARKLFQATNNPDLTHVLKRLPLHLKMKLTVTQEYIDGFHQANNTFLYQLAFDPMTRRLVPVQPYSDDVEKETLTYAGAYYSSDLALQQALGNVDVNTKKKMYDFKPDYNKPFDKSLPRHRLSVWHKHYRPGPDFSEEGPADIQRHQMNGKEVTLKVNGLKLEGHQRKRPRPDADADEGLPTDDDLASIYSSPNAKRHSVDLTVIVPETPESKDREPGNTGRQHRSNFSREDSQENRSLKQETGFGSEERVIKTLSRRNIFAKSRPSSSSTRQDILRGSKVVTSRFFSMKPEQKLQDTAEDNEKEQGVVPFNLPSSVEDTEDIIEETYEAKTLSTVNVNERTGTSRVEVSAVSTLDRLQRFQRSVSAPVLPSTQNREGYLASTGETCTMETTRASRTVKPELDSEHECSHSQESSQEVKRSFMKATTQNKQGAFSWSRSNSSVTSAVKRERDGNTRSFKSLSDFRRKTATNKIEWGGCQKESKDEESPLDDLEGASQESCGRTQMTNLCSIDTDSLHLSQFSSLSYTEDNTQRSGSLSLPGDIEVTASQTDSFPKQFQDNCLDVKYEKWLNNKDSFSGGVMDNEVSGEKINNKSSIPEYLPSPSSKIETMMNGNGLVLDTTTLDQKAQCTDQLLVGTVNPNEYSSLNGRSSDQEETGYSEMSSSLEKEQDGHIDLTSDSDENTPPHETKKQTGMRSLQKKMKRDSDTTPKLPTMPKISPGLEKPSQCKASGLSRRQKSKLTAKTDKSSASGSKQQTLFSFMKKNNGRTNEANPTMPLSPSKQNIICDVTPEGENSLCNKGIVGVQRKIFKL